MDKKIAIITGASRGIGKAVAEYLSQCHYFVILLARNSELLKQISDSINQNGGHSAYFSVDISDSKQIKDCMEEIIFDYGHIDLLFNNAGIFKPGTSSLSDNDMDEVITTNLLGAIYMANAVASQMKKQKQGYIINVSSLAGKRAWAFSGGYNAAKFGLGGFSEALLKELSAYGVKVSTICPGIVASEISGNDRFDQDEMIQTADICKTVGYLLSLSKNAIPSEIVLESLPWVEKISLAMAKAHGFVKEEEKV